MKDIRNLIVGEKAVRISAFAVWGADTPHYCRNVADRVRWLAWKLGLVDKIRQRDKVQEDEMTSSYILMVSG